MQLFSYKFRLEENISISAFSPLSHPFEKLCDSTEKRQEVFSLLDRWI